MVFYSHKWKIFQLRLFYMWNIFPLRNEQWIGMRSIQMSLACGGTLSLYEEYIPFADKLYTQHIEDLKKKGLIQ